MQMKQMLRNMDIGSSMMLNGCHVERVGNAHFMVDGVRYGCGNYSASYAVALTESAISGAPLIRPCSICGKPANIRSWCNQCHSDRVQRYKKDSRK